MFASYHCLPAHAGRAQSDGTCDETASRREILKFGTTFSAHALLISPSSHLSAPPVNETATLPTMHANTNEVGPIRWSPPMLAFQVVALEKRLSTEEAMADAVEAAASATAATASAAKWHEAMRECDAELAGFIDDYRQHRAAAQAAVLRAAKVTTTRRTQRVRLRVGGRLVPERNQLLRMSRGRRSAVDAVAHANRVVDAAEGLRHFARQGCRP